MAEQKIELRKIRDFGENINDTFLFIRQNFKPLLANFFAICGIFMLAHAIFNGIYQSRVFGIFDEVRKGVTFRNNSDFYEVFTPEYFLAILLGLLSYIAMRVVVCVYVKFYLQNKGAKPAIADIWALFIKYYLRVFIYSIPLFILVVIGSVFCLAPGIYLMVVLTPFDMVLIIEDQGFTATFNRCFAIIRGNFWISFAIYLVAGIIYTFSGTIVGMVVGVIVGLGTYFTTNNVGTTAGMVTSLLNVFSGVFYIIFAVSTALQYFNLVERHDGTGILQRVEAMGDNENDFDHIQEQY
jgi:hypothetical protein